MGFGNRSAKAQFREADARGARFAVVLGESELSQGVVQLKSLSDGTQETIPTDQFLAKIQKMCNE
jgi:histidyl-tRNA synthetase